MRKTPAPGAEVQGVAALKGAGIREIGGQVEPLDLPEVDRLRPDELLIDVKAAGAANWDDIARTGGWDLGIKPPMALGVEASGVVRTVGFAVKRFRPGDEVLTHSLPLRYQGAWAQQFVAPERFVAAKPTGMSWEVAGAFPVPALIAREVVHAVALRPGESVLVHGGGGVTGGMLVAVASFMGGRVITTASSQNTERLKAYGAMVVVDYRDENWKEELQQHTGLPGVSVAVNAVRGAAATVMSLVADGGRLATITSDPPESQRGITVTNSYVSPDGEALARLAADFADRNLTIPVAMGYGLSEAGAALEAAVRGQSPGAVLIDPTR